MSHCRNAKLLQFFSDVAKLESDFGLEHRYNCSMSIQVGRAPITRLDRPLGLYEVEVPRISRNSAHEDGQVVRPTHRPPLPPSPQDDPIGNRTRYILIEINVCYLFPYILTYYITAISNYVGCFTRKPSILCDEHNRV
jgi:hypothetical protein